MSARARALALLVGSLLATGGCDGCRDEPQPIVDPAEFKEAAGADEPKGSEKAVLRGVVRLVDGAELPAYRSDQMERRLLAHTQQAALPEACTPPKTTDRQPVQLTPDGMLTNIVLAATDFSRQPERAKMVHEVVIEDCRLTPKVVVAMKGDQLRVTNAGEYPFMPAYGETPVVKTLIRGQDYEVPLDKAGVSPVLCGFTAPCGRTDVVVMLHPIHATTDAEGKFELEDFPAGESVKLSAWHPLFEESTIEVRLEPGEEKSVELVLTPLASQVGASAATAQPADADQTIDREPAAEPGANAAPEPQPAAKPGAAAQPATP